jgi:hypothetical protein
MEYTFEDPCFCQPATKATRPENKPPVLQPLAEERQVPTGLDNPFWKPERSADTPLRKWAESD